MSPRRGSQVLRRGSDGRMMAPMSSSLSPYCRTVVSEMPKAMLRAS